MDGIYKSSSGMMSAMNKLDIHAHNVSNIETEGFKRDQNTFRVVDETNKKEHFSTDVVGEYQDKVYMDDIITDFSPGDVEVTNRELDLSLNDEEGISFFEVSKDDGTYYTRSGSFHTDEEQRLMTLDGSLVTGEDGEPIVLSNESQTAVDEDGTVRNTETGEIDGVISVITVEEDQLSGLRRDHASLFAPMTADEIQNEFHSIEHVAEEWDNNPTIRSFFGSIENAESMFEDGFQGGEFQGNVNSGSLERANVEFGYEMTEIMGAQRMMQMSQEAFSVNDEIAEINANMYR